MLSYSSILIKPLMLENLMAQLPPELKRIILSYLCSSSILLNRFLSRRLMLHIYPHLYFTNYESLNVSKLDNKIVDYIARSYNGEQYIIKKTKMLAYNKEHQHTISKSQHTISKPTHTINKKIIKSLVSKMRIYKNRLLKRACENPNKNIFENIKNKKQKKSKTKQLHLDRINKSLSGDLYNIFHQSEVELFGSDTDSDTYSDIYSDTESEAYYYNDLDYCYFSEQRFMRVYYA
jgi:hypothetical protein